MSLSAKRSASPQSRAAERTDRFGSVRALGSIWWRRGAWLAAVFLVAVLVRLTYAWQTPAFFAGDSRSYLVVADALAHGRDPGIAIHRAVGYPLFLSSVIVLVGDDAARIVLIQHLLGAGTAVLSYAIAQRVYGRVAGIVAATLVAFSAPLVLFEHYILAESLFAFLVMLAVLLMLQDGGSRRGGWLLGGGLVLAVGVAARTVGFVLAPALGAVGMIGWSSSVERRRALEAFSFGFLLATAPLLIVNRVRAADPESVVGTHLYGRIVRHDSGFVLPTLEQTASLDDPRQAQLRASVLQSAAADEPPSVVRVTLRNMLGASESEANRAMRDVAVATLRSQPTIYLLGTVEKIGIILAGAREPLVDGSRAPLYQPADARWLLGSLILVGLVRSVRQSAGRPMLILAAGALGVVVVSAALVGDVLRYRYPLDPLLAILAGGGAAAVCGIPGRVWSGASCWLGRRRRGAR